MVISCLEILLPFFELPQDFLGPVSYTCLAKLEVSLSNLGKTCHVGAASPGMRPACGGSSNKSAVGIKLARIYLLSCLSLSLRMCS